MVIPSSTGIMPPERNTDPRGDEMARGRPRKTTPKAKAPKAPPKGRGRAKAKAKAKAKAPKAAPKAAPKGGGGGGAKRKGRRRGRSLKTFALTRKGAKYNARLNRPRSGLRRYTPLATPLRDVKSSKAQKDKARKYYRKNKQAILKKAKQRYNANKAPALRYAKQYYRKNKPNVNYRRSQLRATRKGKNFNLNAAKKRGVGTTSRKRSRKSRKS